MSSSKASLDEIQEKNHFLENELQTAKAELERSARRNPTENAEQGDSAEASSSDPECSDRRRK
eukprot:745674-Hanusia_phi.AAC.1